NRLHMPAAQPAARFEGTRPLVCLRSTHALILNRRQQFSSWSFYMPIFEYVCKECQHEFEALVFGKQKAECPKCQSKKLERQRSRAGGVFAERLRLSPCLRSNVFHVEHKCGL